MLLDTILKYGEIIAAVIGVFSMIATITPTKVDDEILNQITKFIHFLGMNFGKAENKK